MAQFNPIEVAFMDEVQEFLDTLADAPRDKIMYNIHKVAGGVKDSELFKKLDGNSASGNFALFTMGCNTAFWHFGTSKRIGW